MTSNSIARKFCCSELEMHANAEDVAVNYNSKFREYGIRVLNGGSAVQLIAYCPWCGTKLPDSLRYEWLRKIEKLGLEPGDPSIPEEMKTDVWWKAKQE